MAYIECRGVGRGLRSSDISVEVRDVTGLTAYLNVPKDFISKKGDSLYLPVGVVGEDREKGYWLVELPHETERGTRRLWIGASELTHSLAESA